LNQLRGLLKGVLRFFRSDAADAGRENCRTGSIWFEAIVASAAYLLWPSIITWTSISSDNSDDCGGAH